MTTIKEVAKQSGFSQATISRLFKGDETLSITEETKNIIINTALAMGFDRSKIKTTLEKIVFLFWITKQEEVQDVYFSKLRTTIEKYAKLNNMSVQILTHEAGINAIPKNISGFIGLGSFSTKEIKQLKKRCPNGVLLEINPQPELFDTVKPDSRRITQRAINHFIAAGYTKIGFIGGTYHNPDTRTTEPDLREITFRQYLAENNLLNDKYIFAKGNFSVPQGVSLADEMVRTLGDDLPEAIFISSDTIAVGALQSLNRHNIQIPNQLAIISMNDNDIAKFVSPPLTTYRINVEEIARTAVDLLVDQIVYPRRTTKTVLLNSELVVRESFVD
jgi:LacI family transcriptional regulator